MGRAAKLKRHNTKMRMKRAAKAAKRAEYYSKRGTSKKNKKMRAGKSPFSSAKHAHLIDYCGNVGCVRCHPEFRKMSHQELAAAA